MASVVPALVARLKDLRNVHEQAAQFSTTLTHMTAVQEELRDQLATQGATLNTVRRVNAKWTSFFLGPLMRRQYFSRVPFLSQLEETMKKNSTTLETNFSSLEKRVTALLGKLA